MTTAPDWARVPAKNVMPPNGGASPSAYAEAALADECQRVASAPKGLRNDTLNRAAFSLGQLIAGGELDEGIARRRLEGAGLAVGLNPDEIGATINSGFLAGAAEPRSAPRDTAETKGRHRSPSPSKGDDAAPPASENGDEAGRKGGKQADILIELASGENVDLFHTADGTTYADIRIDGRRETHQLSKTSFKRWLHRAYYHETGSAPNREAINTALGVLDARAHFDGDEREVYMRVACTDDAIYVDLCDATWRAVKVTAHGWEVVSEPSVRFRRTPSMQALPVPRRGGSIEDLKRHFRVEGDNFVLLISWLLAALRGKGPFPILGLTGEHGTGKSLTAEMLRSLIDPSSAPLRSLPRDTRDLFIAAVSGYVLCFDNLSGISAEVSDALCRLSTGGGFSTRALYSDSDEIVINAQRPILTTAITDVASRGDLADRFIMVGLATIADKDRRPERELRAEFEAARPLLLGALLDVVSHGLLNLPDVRLNRLPRMADFAIWIRACEGAVWGAGMHLAAYEANRGRTDDVVIEDDAVAGALVRLMASREVYPTTAGRLLEALNEITSEATRRARDWPLTPRALSGRLRRIAPPLRRAAGIDILFPSDRDRKNRERTLTISKTDREEKGPSQPSQSSPALMNQEVSDDGR